MAATRTKKPSTSPVRRTYVLDTSVLLADPNAVNRFHEHEVVIPVVVITELEGKRHDPELGYFARSALRFLDDLRVLHGTLDVPLPIGDEGGTIRVELNHTDSSSLPSGFRLGDNDTRILSVARNLANEGNDVTIVSKDLPMRVKASAVGLIAEEYRAELALESGWTGMRELEVESIDLDSLYEGGTLDLPEARDLPCHTGSSWCPTRAAGWAGSPPTRRCSSYAATVTRSASMAGRRSSGSRSTSCSTPTSASSRSVAAPAPASPRSRCAPASRRRWSAASTRRS